VVEIIMVDPIPEETETHGPPARHGSPVRRTARFLRFERAEIEQSIPERFEKQVEVHRDRIAVSSKRFSLSYAALNRWANQVAHALIAACGTRSLPIALLLEKDAPQIAAILGVLKAGKFYVPLAPSYPLARNQTILDDAQAPVIVTDTTNLEVARTLGGDSLSILNLDMLPRVFDDSNPRLALSPDADAYILYTSGSTGGPKGIVEIHRNVLHNIMNFTNDHYINCHDRITGLNSFAFSGSLKDIFGALLNGAALFPLELEQVGLHGLADWLRDEKISILSSVSTTFRHFASTLTGRESFPELRVIRIGAEEVTAKDVELFKASFSPDCVLVNGYGATETGTVRIYMIDRETRAVGHSVPIGYPVEGMEVLILDDTGKRLGFNQVGQIAVRSIFLSPGYWRRPDLTAKAFLPDPDGGGRRIYLTGDLGAMAPDGCLIHAGRKDFQIKVRGQRVEVAEIEATLGAAPGVAEAVVVARDDLPEESCLAAYVVPESLRSRPTVQSLRDFLKQRLPDSAIPAVFVFLDSLPLTSSGKIDRHGLPAPVRRCAESTRPFIAPRTELEERLVSIWENLTEFRPIGIADEFFEVGGNSLLAVRLFAEIQKSLGKHLPIETVVAAPTIERLAEILVEAGGPAPRPLVIALRAFGSRPPFFCVPGSEGHPLSFYEFARHGDPDQPFFGVQYPEHSPEQPYPTRIEDLAALFLPEILKIQPRGPYRLGGHSFGGAVAFELAQQLTALGHKVSLLALFDTWGKGYPASRSLPGKLIGHLRHLRTLRFEEKLTYVTGKTLGVLRRFESCFGRVAEQSSQMQTESPQISMINHIAWCRYQPRKFPGRLALFRAEETPDWIGSRFDDPFMGWGDLAAQGVDVQVVPGDHLTLLDQAKVELIARKLNAYLAEEVATNDAPHQNSERLQQSRGDDSPRPAETQR
jgi:amino acid adenylation domain-containing protein